MNLKEKIKNNLRPTRIFLTILAYFATSTLFNTKLPPNSKLLLLTLTFTGILLAVTYEYFASKEGAKQC
jgi:hypothetical protein